MSQQLEDAMERLLDRASLHQIVVALAEVCLTKSDLLEEKNEKDLSFVWQRRGVLLSEFARLFDET